MAKKITSEEEMPKVGEQVSYWRRDPGGKSQQIFAIVMETIGIDWCCIYRHDINELRNIDPNRLSVVKDAQCTCGHGIGYHNADKSCGMCETCKRFEVALPNVCIHEWQEQPGEPPVDVCSLCGETRR